MQIWIFLQNWPDWKTQENHVIYAFDGATRCLLRIQGASLGSFFHLTIGLASHFKQD